MHLIYENTKEEIIAVKRKPRHQSPHLHTALEIVYVTAGSLELGMGQELFHMDEGDIGIIFPNIIHHYQIFGKGKNEAVYINVSPTVVGKFLEILQNKAPINPVIHKNISFAEIYMAIDAIIETQQNNIFIVQAYLQIILARCLPAMELTDKRKIESDDLIYRTVSYMSSNFKRLFLLDDMAKDLGVSKYQLSRIFSKTFHRNFNQYLNDIRLSYACQRLENTNDTITEVCFDSGFESQRTFNRAFKERYKMSPSQYKKMLVESIED